MSDAASFVNESRSRVTARRSRTAPAAWPTRFVRRRLDGAPDVAGLTRSAILHPSGELYLERYDVVIAPTLTVRLHHWRGSDDQHAPHDHPWPNVTTVLAGELVEHYVDGRSLELELGDVVSRPARLAHRLELVSPDAWTLFLAGPIERRWGFETDDGWVHWADWPHAGRLEELEEST